MENDDLMLSSDDDLDDFLEDEDTGEQTFNMENYAPGGGYYGGDNYSSAFSYAYLNNYEGGRDNWNETKDKTIAEATDFIIKSLDWTFEDNEELNNLIKAVIGDIVREQLEKQHLYGVFFLDRDGGAWKVPYTKYRSADECRDNYLTAEEKSYYAVNNYGLIHSVCHKYAPANKDVCKYTYDDLFEAGLEGLTKALNTYTKNGNIKFSTYATNCIQNVIIDLLRRTINVSALPTVPSSLDVPVFKDEGETTIGDNLTDEKGNFAEDVENDSTLEGVLGMIKEILDEMDEGAAYIITHYFGVLGAEKLTKLEIMKRLSLPRSNYERLYAKGINDLKEGLLDRGLDFPDFAGIFG